MLAITALVTIALAITPILGVDTHNAAPAHRRHHEVANRARGDISKRFSGARATFYDVGMGACGQYNQPGDFIVALNQDQFGSGYPGPHCFETITITYGGKTAHATIMDMCPGCPFGGLDFSMGLFTFFADPNLGVLSVDWNFGASGGNPNPPPSSKPQPPSSPAPPTHTTPKSHHQPPTSTWEPVPSPTHTYSPPVVHTTSTTSHTTSHSTTSKSTSQYTPTSTLPSTTPSVVPIETGPDNLGALNIFVLSLANLVVLSIGV